MFYHGLPTLQSQNLTKIISEKKNLAKVEPMGGNPIKRTSLNVHFPLQTSQAHSI